MRIAVANCAFDPRISDPEALLARYHALVGWAGALAEAGADAVTVVQRFPHEAVLPRGRIEYRFVADAGVASRPSWFRGRRMAASLRALRPDVVHVDGFVFPLFVRNLRGALPRSSAIVLQDHGGIHAGSPGFRSWSWRLLHRLGLRAADGFLLTAREQAGPWQQAGIIAPGQTIYEVPEASTDLAAAGDAPALAGRPALLWVGRLDSNKDPITILNGLEAALAGALPDAELTMVYSEHPLLREVRARVDGSPALRGRVHLRGYVERTALPALYAGADLFVLGSHHESACFALIEALSFGVTPVVTDIAAFRALTGGGRLGALFPPGDAPALARALEQLGGADFRGRRQQVREHFTRELSWAAVGRRALEIYRAAAARRTAAGAR